LAEQLKPVWLEFLRPWSKTPQYSRAVEVIKPDGEHERVPVLDEDDYLMVLENTYGEQVNVFVDLFSEPQKKSLLFDCFFMDLDLKDLEPDDFLVLGKKILRRMADFGLHVYTLFSGRGLHFYVPFTASEFVSSKDYRACATKTAYNFVKPRERVFLDTSALGSTGKMVRVVDTLNPKSNLYCVPVDLATVSSYTQLRKLGEKPCEASGSMTPNLKQLKNNLSALTPFLSVRITENRSVIISGEKKASTIPPCVKQCFETLKQEAELPHEGRVLLALYCLSIELPEDEIVNIFRCARDFKERITRYQVNYLRRAGYRFKRCDLLRLTGYCPGKCQYYPSLNRWFRVESVRGNEA